MRFAHPSANSDTIAIAAHQNASLEHHRDRSTADRSAIVPDNFEHGTSFQGSPFHPIESS